MAVYALPVDQRVIDIDSRRFASIEKAIVELITNCDDSYLRIENKGGRVTGKILIGYERHQKGALLTVTDHAEGMPADRIASVLTYGGAYSSLAKDGSGGRGYFGRGLKQAVYGLGYGWIESIWEGGMNRFELYRAETGEYLFNDGDGTKIARPSDYIRLGIPEGSNGTRISVVIDNQQVSIPYYKSLLTSIINNVYLRDILSRRDLSMVNLNEPKKTRVESALLFEEPLSETLIGPDEPGGFSWQGQLYTFALTLKRAKEVELVLKGDERTNGLVVLSGSAVLDCQFFRFENQIGTEFLFGRVVCDDLTKMLAKGYPVISDEREGLNRKEPIVKAFSEEVSRMMENVVKSEQLRLSHVQRAQISQRTQQMIETILQKMNRIAFEELGIRIAPKKEENADGTTNKSGRAVLHFTSPFYYRIASKPFNVTLIINKKQLGKNNIIHFDFQLPDGCRVEPQLENITVKETPRDGRLVFKVIGTEPETKGIVVAKSGRYAAFCEIVLAEDAIAEDAIGEAAPYFAIKKHGAKQDASEDMFRGYELRNLDNDIDRAIYSPEERLIIINTEAPTVRLYVDGQGRFKDGARLLLAELLLDVITDELARHYVDRDKPEDSDQAFRKTKQDMVRRYGVEVHSILLGE